jgi:hypothetical protein
VTRRMSIDARGRVVDVGEHEGPRPPIRARRAPTRSPLSGRADQHQLVVHRPAVRSPPRSRRDRSGKFVRSETITLRPGAGPQRHRQHLE